MSLGRPIKPDEVVRKNNEDIPEYVYDAFNEIISRNFVRGNAKVLQKDVVEIITEIYGGDDWPINWLNIEDDYRNEGWIVMYHKSYSSRFSAEFYDPYYSFKRLGSS